MSAAESLGAESADAEPQEAVEAASVALEGQDWAPACSWCICLVKCGDEAP